MNNAAATIALPALPTISALDMIHAQAWTPTAAELADITAHADFLEAHGLSRMVKISVSDIYTDAKIGALEVTL